MVVFKIYSVTTGSYWIENTEDEAKTLVAKLAESDRVYKYVAIFI